MSVPLCVSFFELESYDGQTILLEGIFRKSLTPKKMRGKGTFMGYAHMEIDGRTVDISEKRSPDEFQTYTDKKVRIQGVLRWDPYKESRESSEIHTRILFGPPQLSQISYIHVLSE